MFPSFLYENTYSFSVIPLPTTYNIVAPFRPPCPRSCPESPLLPLSFNPTIISQPPPSPFPPPPSLRSNHYSRVRGPPNGLISLHGRPTKAFPGTGPYPYSPIHRAARAFDNTLKHTASADFRPINKIEKESFAYSIKESIETKKRTVYGNFRAGRNTFSKPHRAACALKSHGASYG